MANAIKEVELTRQQILEAHATWNLFSGLTYGDNRATEAIIENLDITEPVDKKIRKALEKIRDKHLNIGEDGKPMYKYELDEDGSRAKYENGQDKPPISFDWLPDGKEKAEEEQEAYLEKKEKIKAYAMRHSYLTPCWRYVPDGPGLPAKREEMHHSPADIRRVKYAMLKEVKEESDA